MKKPKFLFILPIHLPIIITLVTFICLYLCYSVIESSVRQYFVEQNEAELSSVIKSVEQELPLNANSFTRKEFGQSLLTILAKHNHVFVSVFDENEQAINNSLGPDLGLAKQQLQVNDLLQTNNSASLWKYKEVFYQVAASKFEASNRQTYTIVAAIVNEQQIEYLIRLKDGFYTLIAFTCVLALLASSFTIYITQRPINRLINKIELISSQKLDQSIEINAVPNKYMGLVIAFNDLLSRLNLVFNRQNNFTADIAHEMRTPITNLATQTQIALTSERSNNDYKEILYSNLEEYERLSRMISDMLFLAQSDNKKISLHFEKINLADVLRVMMDFFEPISEDKNINLIFQGTCVNIDGDNTMLCRVFGNILSNALRYTPENSNIDVVLSQPSAEQAQVVIANPGKMIEAHHIAHLFDRFYRVDSSRQRNDNNEGSGIGLAIVKSIIDLHHGHISVESDQQSTRFIVTLPLQHTMDE